MSNQLPEPIIYSTENGENDGKDVSDASQTTQNHNVVQSDDS